VSIKILGGFARGQLLIVPKGDITRPTQVMLRRRIFDYFQNLEGVVFVDLCAGTGAMGFEAWSRGASLVYLNEASRHVLKSLEENRENLMLKSHHDKLGELICRNDTAKNFIQFFKKRYLEFDENQKNETILFLDPPYSMKTIYTEVLEVIMEEPWYFGQVWIESDLEKGTPYSEWEKIGLKSAKLFQQGGSYIFVTNFPQS
jgi:16S rRNA (guanine966-N2)-methyltransferase